MPFQEFLFVGSPYLAMGAQEKTKHIELRFTLESESKIKKLCLESCDTFIARLYIESTV